MKIEDRIYGNFSINEPVLIEIIKSPAMQRLKGVDQFGLPQQYYPYPSFSRFDHSVGVMLLLKKHNASLEEKAAGLIHDVSHTAFSHLIDWVLGDRKNEDYQDKNHMKMINSSTIPSILKSYSLDPKKIIDIKHYSLLEQPSGELCADRIDYALREFNTWAAPNIVDECINNITTYKGKFVFSNLSSAKDFAYAYAKLQREHWGGAECTMRWEIFSKALKKALTNNILTVDEFYQEDNYIIDKLKASKDPEILDTLNVLSKPRLNLVVNISTPQYKLKKKFRYIDPAFLTENKRVVKLSDANIDYSLFLREQKQLNEYGITVDLLD